MKDNGSFAYSSKTAAASPEKAKLKQSPGNEEDNLVKNNQEINNNNNNNSSPEIWIPLSDDTPNSSMDAQLLGYCFYSDFL